MRERDERRIAETEALFRELNERIAETATRLEVDELELVCECADTSCAHRIKAPLAEYERARADGARFLLAPGHEDERVERVVARRQTYRIVEKLGRVGLLVRRLDPRGGTA